MNKCVENNIQQRKHYDAGTIGILAGGIAHDFNNTLSPILGYAEPGTVVLPENAITEVITTGADA